MIKTVHKLTAWSLIVAICLLSAATPAGTFTIGEERELGEKLLYSVRTTFDLVDDPDVTQYINRVGQSVLEVAGVQYFDYHFYVINDKRFNAFAAPSGLIFFYSGLIATMKTEDEFVSVIAHEIGHIVKRHLAARMEKGKYSSIASLGLALAALAFGGAAAPALLTGALAAGQSMNLHFSRLHEEEADLLAYGWLKKLHRNPEGQVEMLKSMRRIARYRSDKLPQYLLTHPNPEQRLEDIEALIDIDNGGRTENTTVADDFAFLRFKYRILSQVKDTSLFKLSLDRIIANSTSSNFSKIMARYGLSQVAKNEKNYDLALNHLEKVITYFPGKNILFTDKGVIEFAAGQFRKAEESLEFALSRNRSDMYATITLASLLYRKGDLAGAQSYLKTITGYMPEYSQPYFELGQIASDKKQEGLSSFYLGKYYLYEGRLGLAETGLKKALRTVTTPAKIKAECKKMLDKIKQLKK
ncbi:MAG: M48 family metalloprotease [Deltaproteobacteria bacterium]|nr:M48 family metalloprotease [Deltaproteobacteria bacterium]